MAKYIDRETLIADMKKRYCTGCNSYNGVRCRACWVDDATGEIDDAPAADVAPVVHGRWEPRQDVPGFVRCSACKDCNTYDEWADGNKWSYCPNCGAKMDGGAE